MRRFKHSIANIITFFRIILSVALLFCPVLDVPGWLYIWIAIIAIIKAANITAGYIRKKEFASVHSLINKVTGALLFVFPLTLAFIDLRYSAAVICTVASVAAIHEGYLINRNLMNRKESLPG